MRVTPRLASIKLGDCSLFELTPALVRFDHVAPPHRKRGSRHCVIACRTIELGSRTFWLRGARNAQEFTISEERTYA
jgi:hypothetical protein